MVLVKFYDARKVLECIISYLIMISFVVDDVVADIPLFAFLTEIQQWRTCLILCQSQSLK